jgi:hypothetical protein
MRVLLGCYGYVVWVALDMLHGLLWICSMGCCGYAAWVAVDMLCGLLWICCMGCSGLGGPVFKKSCQNLPPDTYIS